MDGAERSPCTSTRGELNVRSPLMRMASFWSTKKTSSLSDLSSCFRLPCTSTDRALLHHSRLFFFQFDSTLFASNCISITLLSKGLTGFDTMSTGIGPRRVKVREVTPPDMDPRGNCTEVGTNLHPLY